VAGDDRASDAAPDRAASRGRTLPRLAAGLVLAGGVLAPLALAAPAWAASASIVIKDSSGGQVTDGGQVTTFGDVLSVSATVPVAAGDVNGHTWMLIVTSPTGQGSANCTLDSEQVPANPGVGGSAEIGPKSIETTAFNQGTCASDAPPPYNGSYTITLYRDGTAAKDATSATNFTFALPPAPVQGVRATAASNGSTVTVGWAANSEPDLTAYDLYTQSAGNDSAAASGLSPSQYCTSGTCSATLSAPPPGNYAFVVRADRTTSPGGSVTVQSADSSAADVSVPKPPPSPSPSAGGNSSGGGVSGGGGSSLSGGSGSGRAGAPPIASRRGVLQAFKNFVPAPVTVAPPNVSAPAPITVFAPLPEGTYQPELPYGKQTTPGQLLVFRKGGSSFSSALSSVATSGPLWTSVAGALLLLLIAMHLQSWLRRSVDG